MKSCLRAFTERKVQDTINCYDRKWMYPLIEGKVYISD